MFLRSERQFQSLCAVCAMERKIEGGGGWVCLCQGKHSGDGVCQFVNQRIEISRINDILTDVWGGGGLLLSRTLSSIPYPNICGANFNDEEYVQTDCSEAIPVFLLKSRTVDMYYTYCTGVLLCFLFDCWQIN